MDYTNRKQVEWAKKKRRRKWFFRISALLVIAAIGLISYLGWNIANAISQSFDSSVGSSKLRAKPVQPRTEPFAILLIGADATNADDPIHGETGQDGWRSDVLMVIAVNPKTKTAKLVSIPRDTYVRIANTHIMTKINGAPGNTPAGMNKVKNVMETVENFMGIPIDYYAKVNFQGFVDVVDAVDGIDVNVTYPFTGPAIHKYITFKVGPQHLDGMHALAYVRQRHQDPEGDIGRNKREQEVIGKIIDKITSLDGITTFSDVAAAVGKNFSYNIPTSDLPSIIAVYQEIPKKNIQRIELQTTPKIMHHVYYEICSSTERYRIMNILRTELQWKGTIKR